MSTGYASRLQKRAQLASKLIQAIVGQKTISYQKLALLIGLEKSDLRYFVGLPRSNKTKGALPTDIKVAKFSKILDWIENTDFSSAFYSREQQELARRIKETFVRDDKSEVYETLASGFNLSNKEATGDLNSLLGHYICYRKRGTSKLITTFSLTLVLSSNAAFCEWRAKFLESELKAEEGKKFKREQMKTHQVSGYALLSGGNLTCIGRRVNETEMHLLNIMSRPSSNGYLWGLYSSFSREEAIARPVCLVPRNPHATHETDDELGDFHLDEVREKIPVSHEHLDYDFSVTSDGPKAEKGFS